MMLVPRKREFDLLDDIFDEPMFNFSNNNIMKTDIKDHKNSYEIVVDLPGYEKDNIEMTINDGYLTINAKTKHEVNEGNEEGSKFIRKERYYGECSRSFYVGNTIKEEDIKANFKNGVLSVSVPKKDPKKEISEKKRIQID